MNRRKARAGRSFENHVEYLLTRAKIPHKMRPSLGLDGKPDVIIPNEAAYFDSSFPHSKLFVIGLKTTCKDRWRQVLNEAPKHPSKHIFTLQQGITGNQLTEMHKAHVTLVVPKPLQKSYPAGHTITILKVEDFIERVKHTLHI
ncbi:MAG: type II restriction endonuclease [Acidobacteriaceae bacterium]